MNKFILLIISLFLIFTPFYIFPSGLPQPADILVGFGLIIFIIFGGLKKLINDIIVYHLLKFILLVSVINLFYFLVFTSQGVSNRMFAPPLYYIFNCLIFIMFMSLLKFSESKKALNQLSLVIIISLALQSLLAFLGIQGKAWGGPRGAIFFNNPNQLGYYALLMISLFAILPSTYRRNKISIIFALSLSIYLILHSGSRAALAGALLLGLIMLYKERFQFKSSSILFIIGIGLSSVFFLQTNFVQNRINLLKDRSNRNLNSNITEAQIRGYDRFWVHPEYILYGAGEGMVANRLESYHNGELHSGFGTILFSYGILGLIFFLQIIYKVIENDKTLYLIFLSPIFFYNLTHQGLRDSLFWTLLASIYIVSQQNNSIRKRK